MIFKIPKIKVFMSRVLCLVTIVFLCLFVNKRCYTVIYRTIFKEVDSSVSKIVSIPTKHVNVSKKYILLWTNSKSMPFSYFKEGNDIFIEKSCKWTNCYVTGNKNQLGSYTEFNVVAFNGPQIPFTYSWPRKRSIHQKYVYANIESASNYPINNNFFNGVFNWTWTYKLTSDAVWGYFIVKDANNTVIGPGLNVPWLSIDNMDPTIDAVLKKTIQNKKRTAVWFASNCNTGSGREDFVRELKYQLKYYKMDVDVYGKCGSHQCPKEINDHCLEMVRKNYYFYLAFENALSEDYVTEKLVYALKNDAVPVVYGGANYSRFLPKGIYLDARKLGPKLLAKTMYETIQSPKAYSRFFRWKKHYSFHFKHESPETDDYCKFCAILNNNDLMEAHSVYSDFRSWWMDGVPADRI